MDIMDKLNGVARKVSDKAGELVELGKLNIRLQSEADEVEALKIQLGEICFGKYRSGDELDPEIENICAQIEKHKRNMAETQRTINKMKENPADPIDLAAMGYCPYCGSELVKDAAFCPKCGQQLRK